MSLVEEMPANPDFYTMKFQLNGRIWIEGDERFIGIGRWELLTHIRETGSLSASAKAMGMSYKRAWDLVQSMNKQAPEPLVVTQTGGEKGGGSVLSEEGVRWLERYGELHRRFRHFLETECADLLP